MEEYRTGTGQLVYVHEKHRCMNSHACVIHEPSDHHMLGWPTHWRDLSKYMERICSHGIGHPDPDEIDPPVSHTCDGCCLVIQGSLVVEKELN